MVFADVSMWQAFIPAEVTAVIVKATQGRRIFDSRYDDHLHAARARGMRHIGHYHFLTSDPAEMQWSFYRQTLETVGGGLRVGELIALDWESNAITGEPAPDAAVAREWLDLANAYASGRVCWYSYRSLAARARQSGAFPEPLWLADPNPDGRQWAERLGAFLLQSGQGSHDGITIDVNDVIDPAQLEQLCGYTQEAPDMQAKELVDFFGGEAAGVTLGLDGVCYFRGADGIDRPLGVVLRDVLGEAIAARVGVQALQVAGAGGATMVSPAVIAGAVRAELADALGNG